VSLDVLLALFVLLELLLLEVNGASDVGDGARRERGATGGVDQAVDLGRAHDLLIEIRDVLEEREEIDLLLIVHAKQVVIRLSCDCENGSSVELRVVETVEQMDRTGP
jgi:hypothetical protein